LDGGFIAAGETGSFGNGGQLYLVKTNASGDTLWTRTYGATNDEGTSVQQTQDMGYIVAGRTISFGNDSQVYLVKTDAQGRSGVESPVKPLGGSTMRQLEATPNPFISFARVPGHERERFAVYDVSGRKVGTYQGDRIGEGLNAGVYFIVPADKKALPVRIIKVR
jgi:hypothetical protein